MLITSAWLRRGTSCISSIAADISGEAPIANSPLAEKFAATTLVILWIRGFWDRICCKYVVFSMLFVTFGLGFCIIYRLSPDGRPSFFCLPKRKKAKKKAPPIKLLDLISPSFYS
ncbi:hypothetical protein PMCN01_1869 [Pasteurella multocida subsp. multocida HB01]|nr:hypothetical protein PMCN03_1867 [Pasteurella multocida subsp. multocida str. HB03]ANJ91086.1 hypothetical protein PMCN01_1869 [Pasteurella multocida subsp. multocida HB01]